MPHVYVTGHKNPDTDTIASAIGYAEYKNLVDPENRYVAARLGEVNAQTAWALKKSGAEQPELLEHIMLRVKDVMAEDVAVARKNDPLRNVGLTMAKRNISQLPIVEDDGSLTGIITERNLARMYVRESRGASTFAESPVSVGAMVEVLEGELLVGEEDRESSGQLWVISMSVDSMGQSMEPGDIVVIGDRPKGQRRAIELGAGVLVVSNGVRPEDEVLELARERGTAVVLSPLDSYVTSRLIQLSVPCWEVMSENPLTVSPDDLVTEITEQVMEVHYRAAIAVDDKQGAHRGRDEDRPPEPQTEARAPRGPRRDRAERQGRREGRGRRDPGPPPRRGHRDDLSHPRHLRPRRLDGDPDRGALQGERPETRGVDREDAARGRSSRTR